MFRGGGGGGGGRGGLENGLPCVMAQHTDHCLTVKLFCVIQRGDKTRLTRAGWKTSICSSTLARASPRVMALENELYS